MSSEGPSPFGASASTPSAIGHAHGHGHAAENEGILQSHCSCTLLAHVVWSTDRRIAVLDRRIEPWLRDMLTAKAIEAGSRLVGIGVADDHLHSLLRLPSTVTLAAVVQRLKGASSYECNQLFGLKGNQPALQTEAIRLLGDLSCPAATTIDTSGATRRVQRRLYLTEQMAGFGWDPLRTVLRVESRSYAYAAACPS